MRLNRKCEPFRGFHRASVSKKDIFLTGGDSLQQLDLSSSTILAAGESSIECEYPWAYTRDDLKHKFSTIFLSFYVQVLSAQLIKRLAVQMLKGLYLQADLRANRGRKRDGSVP